jgi:hypothetical protein
VTTIILSGKEGHDDTFLYDHPNPWEVPEVVNPDDIRRAWACRGTAVDRA